MCPYLNSDEADRDDEATTSRVEWRPRPRGHDSPSSAYEIQVCQQTVRTSVRVGGGAGVLGTLRELPPQLMSATLLSPTNATTGAIGDASYAHIGAWRWSV